MSELVHKFEAETCPRTWLLATEFLNAQPDRSAYNVVLAIRTPELMTPADFATYDCLDRFLHRHDRPSIAAVASTIFPANFYLEKGAHGVFEDYCKIHPRLPSHWGTYAGRILSRSATGRGNTVHEFNPLRVLVEKLKRHVVGVHLRAVYELNMLDAHDLLEIPIYAVQSDGKRTRGQPCLMHLSFKLRAHPPQVSLAVMYRNHFYIEKALGNLIGLAQLLSFVSAEAGVGVGPLVCHSTLAQLDTGTWGVGGVAKLIQQCRQGSESVRQQSPSPR